MESLIFGVNLFPGDIVCALLKHGNGVPLLIQQGNSAKNLTGYIAFVKETKKPYTLSSIRNCSSINIIPEDYTIWPATEKEKEYYSQCQTAGRLLNADGIFPEMSEFLTNVYSIF